MNTRVNEAAKSIASLIKLAEALLVLITVNLTPYLIIGLITLFMHVLFCFYARNLPSMLESWVKKHLYHNID